MNARSSAVGKGLATALVLIAIAASAKLWYGRAQPQPSKPADPPAPPPVTVQTTVPQHRDIWRTLSLTGDTVAYNEVTLYAKVAGYLQDIFVDKGDQVKRGNSSR